MLLALVLGTKNKGKKRIDKITNLGSFFTVLILDYSFVSVNQPLPAAGFNLQLRVCLLPN